MGGRFKNTVQRMLHPGFAAVALDLALIVALAVFIGQRTSDSAQATTTTAPPPIRSRT